MWVWYAFGSALFAGLVSVLAKCGIKTTNSTVATAIRTIVVLIFAWALVFITGVWTQIFTISAHTLLFLVLSGLATGASWLCYFKALQLGDINQVTPVDKSSVVLAMLLAFIFLGEFPGWTGILGMIMIAVGTFLMIEKKEGGGAKGNWTWLIYAILSAVFAALTSILGKVGIEGVDSNLGTAIRTIVVLVMAWVMVFITRKGSDVRKINAKELVFIVLSGFATGFSWLCFYRALQEGPASIVVPIDKLSILVSIAFAALFFKERLTNKSLFGLIILVAGTLLLLV